MAKVFISYKYGDKHVRQHDSYSHSDWLLGIENGNYLTARDYVTYLMEKVLTSHTNKAEKDNEDISHLSEEAIQQKLYKRIYDSTVTIVLISKNMKESKEERLQWIPREVMYSLKNKTREDRTSYTNGILAVVLPDEDGSYDHAIVHEDCGVRAWQTHSFFKVISEHMFNRLNKNQTLCSLCSGYHHHGDDHSYIHPVKWDTFLKKSDEFIAHVLNLKDRTNEFKFSRFFD